MSIIILDRTPIHLGTSHDELSFMERKMPIRSLDRTPQAIRICGFARQRPSQGRRRRRRLHGDQRRRHRSRAAAAPTTCMAARATIPCPIPSRRPACSSRSLDNIGADGDAEGDSFVSIENITGSQYNDDLWGDNGENALNGMSGNDSLKGFGGNDTLHGEAGNDILDGGTGTDTMVGGTRKRHLLRRSPKRHDNGIRRRRHRRGAHQRELLPPLRRRYRDPGGHRSRMARRRSFSTAMTAATISSATMAANIHRRRYGGVDQMTGRGGNDTYYVYQASDRVIENGGQGNDTVYASVSWTPHRRFRRRAAGDHLRRSARPRSI